MTVDNSSNNDKKTSCLLRQKVLKTVHEAGASHIGSCLSVLESLFAIYQSIDIQKIKNREEDRDRVIVSKGHSAAALYAVQNFMGLMSEQELSSYYSNNSLLGGHVTHRLPFVEHSTGALGHGLSVAVGIGFGLKAKRLDARVYAVLGDGELHEGSNWEAIMFAGHKKLNNLSLFVDLNNLSGIGSVDSCCSLSPLMDKLKSFDFQVCEVDGHRISEISSAIQSSKESKKPSAIICNTVKGKGVSFMEGNNVWHYRPPGKTDYDKAVLEVESNSS